MSEDALLMVSDALRLAFLASLVLLAIAVLRLVLLRRAAKRKAHAESVQKRIDAV